MNLTKQESFTPMATYTLQMTFNTKKRIFKYKSQYFAEDFKNLKLADS